MKLAADPLRGMKPWIHATLGAMLLVGGAAFALLFWGVVAIADCSADCHARGEFALAVGLALFATGVAALGGWMLVSGARRRRARTTG